MMVIVKAKSTRKMRLDRMAICFERLAAKQPEPKTELDFSSPYTLLVAVVLSAQWYCGGSSRWAATREEMLHGRGEALAAAAPPLLVLSAAAPPPLALAAAPTALEDITRR